MSTEVTPDLMRLVADAWEGNTASDDYVRSQMRAWADRLERESKPLPTVPGWYPSIVVERGGQSCTGALLTQAGIWATALSVDYSNYHDLDARDVTIRWAEQDGKTPGQTLWEAGVGKSAWSTLTPLMKDRQEYAAAAVLAAHGTPTLTDEDRAEEYQQGWAAGHKAVKPASLVLTPVGEHPEPGTRGLLPVEVGIGGDGWLYNLGQNYLCTVGSWLTERILADPRPDGAQLP